MNKIKLLVASLSLSVVAIAQSYEGSIEFKMETSKDTTTNIYYVKGNDVKLDQIGRKSGKVEGSFVFDLSSNEIKYVNPVRKVWGEHKSETTPMIKGTCVSAKGTNTKMVQGQKCTEYTVKNTEENTQITYWIASNKYDFFAPLVKLWNRKDKQSIYFNQIKDLPKGSMPLLSEEKTISDGKLVSKLEVSKISKASIDASKLSIPADYKKFEQK
ncbi:MAG: hypothetical protein K0S53_2445 [Bacteroidetes bacterium]|jgi:hypothetical protein|nr:hypothetical protein [Bacteroidota bacterium]MDF2450883.1 hypothetical protein [Bacteroidota bacterium]